MAEIVNLRQFRKRKLRSDAGKTAQQNRARHGRAKADKKRDQAETAAAEAFLDGHRRDPDKT